MKVIYEYDKNKNNINLTKHGLSFEYAYLIYENINKLTLQVYSNNELRFNDIAMLEIGNKILLLVYVIRQDKVRVISLRTASKKERKLYEKFIKKES